MKISTLREKIAYCEEQKIWYQGRIDEYTQALNKTWDHYEKSEIRKSKDAFTSSWLRYNERIFNYQCTIKARIKFQEMGI